MILYMSYLVQGEAAIWWNAKRITHHGIGIHGNDFVWNVKKKSAITSGESLTLGEVNEDAPETQEAGVITGMRPWP